MSQDAEAQGLFTLFEPDAPGLLGLVERTCQALQAMATSLEALDSVLVRLQRLGSTVEPPSKFVTETRNTVARVIALLWEEGPPLLFRAQAMRVRLRLHGSAAGRSAAAALRMLHADLDGLAAFQAADAPHWGFILRRLRANTMILLAEFDGQRRRLAQLPPAATPPPLEVPQMAGAAR